MWMLLLHLQVNLNAADDGYDLPNLSLCYLMNLSYLFLNLFFSPLQFEGQICGTQHHLHLLWYVFIF